MPLSLLAPELRTGPTHFSQAGSRPVVKITSSVQLKTFTHAIRIKKSFSSFPHTQIQFTPWIDSHLDPLNTPYPPQSPTCYEILLSLLIRSELLSRWSLKSAGLLASSPFWFDQRLALSVYDMNSCLTEQLDELASRRYHSDASQASLQSMLNLEGELFNRIPV